jgi:hypothetical protein
VALSLLKVGILDCVGKGATPIIRQLGGESAGGFISPIFLGPMSYLLKAGALMWSHQRAGLQA